MRSNKQLFTRRGAWAIILPVFALILVACGGENPPVLVIPTAAATAVAPAPAASAIPPTPTPAEPQPTATLPPAPTIAPPLPTALLPTAVPMATAGPTTTPVATVGSLVGTEYRVAFVAANDTLNVRRRPDAGAAILMRLPADATGIAVIDEGETIRGGSLWLPVETEAGDGWVNSRYLTEAVSPEVFCSDPAINDLLVRLEEAVAEEDGKLLGELVHADRGLRLRLNWWNEEVVVAGEDVQTLFRAAKRYDWGVEDGSGEAIRGSFSEVALPRLERDLLGATVWDCDQGQFGGTAGATVLPEGYEAVNYYSAHRPAPAEQELDWGTWLIGIERWEGRYYLSYLVHYRWEI